jgi:hypothetical protein
MLMYKLREIFPVALGASLFQFLLSMCVGFLAGMAVTDNWL